MKKKSNTRQDSSPQRLDHEMCALPLPLPQYNFIVTLLALKTLVAYKLSLFHFWALVALIVVRGYKVVTMANPKTAALASTLHAAN